MKSIENRKNLLFEDILSENIAFLKGKRLLVAFSGGKDSLALLDFLNKVKCEFGFELFACYVNHGLRGSDSDFDEEFCRHFCEKNEVGFVSKNISTFLKSDKGLGLEAAARKYRYLALEEARLELSCDLVLTAHSFDDAMECFFVDLCTGASIFTMSGVAKQRDKILRPMLGAKTSDIEDYLKRNNLEPTFDKSNNDLHFVRNMVRHNFMPALGDLEGAAYDTIARVQAQSRKLNLYFEEATRRAILKEREDYVEFDRDILDKFKEIELEFLFGNIFSKRARISAVNISEAIILLKKERSARINMPSGFIFEVSYDRARFFKKELIDFFSVEKEIGIDNIKISDIKIKLGSNLVSKKLTVRSRLSGDKFGNYKLKDLFIDKKLGLFLRDRAVLIVDESGKIIFAEYISEPCEDVLIERSF